MNWLEYGFLTDAEWRALKRSQDRATAYGLAWKGIALVVGLVVVLVACGLPEWLISRL